MNIEHVCVNWPTALMVTADSNANAVHTHYKTQNREIYRGFDLNL